MLGPGLGLGLKLELGLGTRASTGVRGRARARSRARTRAREGLRREQGGSKAAGLDGNWDSAGDSWPGPRALALRSLPLPLLTPAGGARPIEIGAPTRHFVKVEYNRLHDRYASGRV